MKIISNLSQFRKSGARNYSCSFIKNLSSMIYLQAVRIEHCERVHIIVTAKRVCVANCRECILFLGVNQQPLIVGDNHKLQVSVLYLQHVLSYSIPCY